MVVEGPRSSSIGIQSECAALLLVMLLARANPVQTTKFGTSLNVGVPGLIALNAFTTNGYDIDGDRTWDVFGPATYVAGSVNLLGEINLISAVDLIESNGYAVANSLEGGICGAVVEVDSNNDVHIGPMQPIRVAGQDTYCIPGN